MALLDDDEIEAALVDLPGWERVGDVLVREVRFPNFREAIAFVVRLSYEAEAADHHPDVDIRYNRVLLALASHSEGGITVKDIDMARALQALAP